MSSTRIPQVNLEPAAARAQRHLDGMTVNRDDLARDVLDLVAEIRYWRTLDRERRESPQSMFDNVFGR